MKRNVYYNFEYRQLMEKKDNIIETLMRELKGIRETSALMSSKASELETLIQKHSVIPDEGTVLLVGNIRGTLMKSENTLSKEISRLKTKN